MYQNRKISWAITKLCLAIIPYLASCSSPTDPSPTIWDLDSHIMYFVARDHKTVKDTYRIGGDAYVTILDIRSFGTDTTKSLTFVSSIGDTERVAPYLLPQFGPSFGDYYGGGTIPLLNSSHPAIDDGMLDVGDSVGTITVIYEMPNHFTHSIAADIKP